MTQRWYINIAEAIPLESGLLNEGYIKFSLDNLHSLQYE